MTKPESSVQHIAIIGAGFTGVAMAATLHRQAKSPLVIHLFEKSGQFGAGEAYRTPYSWHLLNARAGDMSAFEDDPEHFVQWLKSHAATYLDPAVPPPRQFVQRVLYHQYLCNLMAAMFRDKESCCKLELVPDEVVDLQHAEGRIKLITKDNSEYSADKVVFAHGNNPPAPLPFDLPASIKCIENPWDYTALKEIPADDPVLIMGTGLSMVDAVLTLHHQKHRGKIYAVSRRGLLPLPHSENRQVCSLDVKQLPQDVRGMMKMLRTEADKLEKCGGDWRAIMHQMRHHLQDLWRQTSASCKKRFLRHILPYWNVHRHRVHVSLANLLDELTQQGQLSVMAGRIISIKEDGAHVRLRRQTATTILPIRHIINCIGSSHDLRPEQQPLLNNLMCRGDISFDELKLGLAANARYELITAAGTALPGCFTLGPPMRGELWECIAVPEIRLQCQELANYLLHEQRRVEQSQQQSKL